MACNTATELEGEPWCAVLIVYQMRCRLSLQKMCCCKCILLFNICLELNWPLSNSTRGSEHTVSVSQATCSLRLFSSTLSSFLCLSSSSSWSFSFSLSCCFFSISARRRCAAEVELCESVPSSAPKSLWPRLRSSVAPTPLPAKAALFRPVVGLDGERRSTEALV